jgi:type VI secretion system secreted protein VgrG
MDFAANVAHHRFEISTLSPDTFTVLSYRGEEAISQPFRYEIALASADPEVAFDAVVNQPAVLTTRRGGGDEAVNGIVVDFREEGPSAARGRYRYRAVLVPRLWGLSLRYQSRIFQEQTVEEIVTEVLDGAGLPGSAVRFELSGRYAPREYCVQYQETDLALVQRLLEYEGIRFFFEHDGREDVLVISDDPAESPPIPGSSTVGFESRQGMVPDEEAVYRFVSRERVVTGSVVLKDYNYRTPETNLEVESQINGDMPGLRYEYGTHFEDADTGERLARVRNEEIECRRRMLQGESDCAGLRPGYVFTLAGHYRSDADGAYLVTHVEHHGTHAGSEAEFAGNGRRRGSDGAGGAGIEPRRGGEGRGGEAGSGSDAGGSGAASDVVYRNTFTCIPAGVPYRPPRTTPVPQVPGLMTARTESAGGDYAHLDEEGRYHLKMHFDRSPLGDGEASRPVRKAQQNTGPGYGIHFPEHADTEMVWACVDGNPDRPIALSTVPNPSQATPVTASNKAQNVIRTWGQNELTFDDTKGSENVFLHATKDWTTDVANDKTQSVGRHETTEIGANQSQTVGANKTLRVGGNHEETISANMRQNVAVAKSENVGASKSLAVGGAYQVSVGAGMNETVGGAKSEEVGGYKGESVGGSKSENVGGSKTASMSESYTLSVGDSLSVQVGENRSVRVSKDVDSRIGGKRTEQVEKEYAVNAKKIQFLAEDQIVLKCGKAELILKKNGDVFIKGKKIQVKGKGDVIVKGRNVKQN